MDWGRGTRHGRPAVLSIPANDNDCYIRSKWNASSFNVAFPRLDETWTGIPKGSESQVLGINTSM
jgi:hypothetical protein